MLVKRFIILVLTGLFALLSSGCWDAVNVNNKSLITLVALDRKEEQLIFHIELPNLALGQSGGEGGGAGGGHEQFSVVQGKGDTLTEARLSLDYKMDKPLFLGTVRSLVLTEDLAKYGLEKYMYRMQSDPEHRKAVGIVTTSENLDEFFDVKPANNVSIGHSIDELISSLYKKGHKVKNTTSDVLEFLASDSCFVLPDIGLMDGDIVCTGYTVIHRGKHNGFIPAEETKGLVWILADHPEWSYVVSMGDYEATVDVTLKKKTITPLYSKDNLTMDLDFEFESEIMYLSDDIAVGRKQEDQIRQELQKLLLQDLHHAVEKSLSLQCDYLGLKNIFRIHYPNEAKKLNWQKTYINSKIKISAKTSIEPGGMADFQERSKSKESE